MLSGDAERVLQELSGPAGVSIDRLYTDLGPIAVPGVKELVTAGFAEWLPGRSTGVRITAAGSAEVQRLSMPAGGE